MAVLVGHDGKKGINYPSDHRPAMRVPKGGSMCANCKYLKDAENRICGEPNFVRWNGSEVIPGKIDEYCSDWWEMGKVGSTASRAKELLDKDE